MIKRQIGRISIMLNWQVVNVEDEGPLEEFMMWEKPNEHLLHVPNPPEAVEQDAHPDEH